MPLVIKIGKKTFKLNIRIGYGFDVHALRDGEEFVLGGIVIPHHKGTYGHSDADVLIHAICDAILGAANLRDIGYHFPPSDPQYKGIDSTILLEEVIRLINEQGYQIGNIDSTIALEKPKVNPYIPEMKKVLSACMNVSTDDISIKATTTEKLGFQGREEGVSAQVVALIHKV